MSKPDSNQPRSNFEEDEIDLEFVKKFIAEMLADKENFKSANPKISRILESLPKKLQEYLLELQRLEKEKKSEEKQDLNQQDRKNRLDKNKKIDERIKQITKEIFIISCASNKPLEESLKFHAACKLSVEDLSKFGECGLSPLMATMLSGKSDADLKKLINLGANVNEKNAYGFTVLDFAELVGSKAIAFLKENGAQGLNSNQKEEGRQREEDDKKQSKKVKNSDEKLEQKNLAREEANRARMQQEQVMIVQSMLALELYQEIIEQNKKQQQVAARLQQENLEQTKAKEIAEKNALTANETLNQKLDNQQSRIENQSFSKASKSETEITIEKIIGSELKEVNINKLLFNAVNAGQSMLAILLVHFGADVNYREGTRSVLDLAVEKGNGSLISVLSSISSPETLSSAFAKVINNGNYSDQTLAALTNQKLEPQKSIAKTGSPQERESNPIITKPDNIKDSFPQILEPKPDSVKEITQERVFNKERASSPTIIDLAQDQEFLSKKSKSEVNFSAKFTVVDEKPDPIQINKPKTKELEPEIKEPKIVSSAFTKTSDQTLDKFIARKSEPQKKPDSVKEITQERVFNKERASSPTIIDLAQYQESLPKKSESEANFSAKFTVVDEKLDPIQISETKEPKTTSSAFRKFKDRIKESNIQNNSEPPSKNFGAKESAEYFQENSVNTSQRIRSETKELEPKTKEPEPETKEPKIASTTFTKTSDQTLDEFITRKSEPKDSIVKKESLQERELNPAIVKPDSIKELSSQILESQNKSDLVRELSKERLASSSTVIDLSKPKEAVLDKKIFKNDFIAENSIKDSQSNPPPKDSFKGDGRDKESLTRTSKATELDSKKLSSQKPSSSVIPKEAINVSGKRMPNQKNSITKEASIEKADIARDDIVRAR